MGYRVDRITVTMDVTVEFGGGSHSSTFTYEPKPDDPLVALALETHEAMLLAAAKAAGTANVTQFL